MDGCFAVYEGERLAAYAAAETEIQAVNIARAYYVLSRGAAPDDVTAKPASDVPPMRAAQVRDYGFSWLPEV